MRGVVNGVIKIQRQLVEACNRNAFLGWVITYVVGGKGEGDIYNF